MVHVQMNLFQLSVLGVKEIEGFGQRFEKVQNIRLGFLKVKEDVYLPSSLLIQVKFDSLSQSRL